MDKIKRHPLMTAMIWWWSWMAVILTVANIFSLWLYFLAVPVFAIYLWLLIYVDGHYEAVCSVCGYSPWLKSDQYCVKCGGKMLIQAKSKPNTCSKGHVINPWQQYCRTCGEKLEPKSKA